MYTRTSKATKRVRLALVVLAGALVLPGFAAADHLKCTPGAPPSANPADPKPCGPYSPQFTAGGDVPFTDTPSSLSFRFNQNDHDQPVLGITYLAPKGWQLFVNSLRQSQISEGPGIGTGPATSCSQVIIGEEKDGDDDAAVLGRAENIGGGVGATAHIKDTRGGEPLRFGYARSGPAKVPSSRPRNQNPSLSFLNWSAANQQGTLCMYLYANTDRLTEQVPCTVNTSCNPFTGTQPREIEYAREHIIPIKLSKVKPGEVVNGKVVSSDFDWKFEFDLTSFYATDKLFKEGISISDLYLGIQALSGGNWNQNDTLVPPKNESIVFSKTPSTPGNYEFRSVFTTCRDGITDANVQSHDSPPPTPAPTNATEKAEALPVSALCVGGTTLSVERSVFQEIKPSPDSAVLGFGKLTGPAGVLPQATVPRFGLIRGTNQVQFTWSQPTMPFGWTIKGYLLTVATPGLEQTRHFERVITNPADGSFNASVCGPTGADANCSLTLNFPLSTIGPDPLDIDGKFDVSLVTLYEGQGTMQDMRSDKKCDDGTGFGAACPVADQAFLVTPHATRGDFHMLPGVSTWQFMLRSKAWPVTYFQTETVIRSGGREPSGSTAEFQYTVPNMVLFVDFALRQGEVAVWNSLGREERFAATSNQIQGDNANGGTGTVVFGSQQATGHTRNFQFEGRITAQDIPALLTTRRAYGVLTVYDTKGVPGALPPGGAPEGHVRQFAAGAPI